MIISADIKINASDKVDLEADRAELIEIINISFDKAMVRLSETSRNCSFNIQINKKD